MARCDRTFCRIETSFVRKAVFRNLSPNATRLYLYCWCYAVEERREQPSGLKDIRHTSYELSMPSDAILTAYSELTDNKVKLLKRDRWGNVTVLNVKDKHPRFDFKEPKRKRPIRGAYAQNRTDSQVPHKGAPWEEAENPTPPPAACAPIGHAAEVPLPPRDEPF